MDLSRVTWRKSSHSQGNGGECVEVGVWRKSSRSTQNGSCVEVAAISSDTAIAVRDSKNPDGPKLAFSPRAWSALVGTVKDGKLDL
jgi:hypothetical protein